MNRLRLMRHGSRDICMTGGGESLPGLRPYRLRGYYTRKRRFRQQIIAVTKIVIIRNARRSGSGYREIRRIEPASTQPEIDPRPSVDASHIRVFDLPADKIETRASEKIETC